jgi:hypothetical protein
MSTEYSHWPDPKFEQGRGLKVLVAFWILLGLVLTITFFVLRYIFPHHE